jgi:hypothetical protein
MNNLLLLPSTTSLLPPPTNSNSSNNALLFPITALLPLTIHLVRVSSNSQLIISILALFSLN